MLTAISPRPQTKPRTKRSARLLAAVEPFERIVIVMHDNPDPDAIAAGWAAKYLLDRRTDKQTRLIGGGDIIRAENRQMVKLLGPPLELVDTLAVDEQTAAILVDCGPEAANHLLGTAGICPVAVIDHHDPGQQPAVRAKASRGWPRQLGKTCHPWFDIRPHVAASATIAATYLREQRLVPPTELATALLYAIRTETRGRETQYSRIDRVVLPWLTRHADPALLANIEDAPLSRGYFSDLVLALQSTFIYHDTAYCMLPHAQGPETVGELADLLIRCEGVRRVLCAAVFERSILLSVRTDEGAGNASKLLAETMRDLGRSGGHAHRAGGKLHMVASGEKVPGDVQSDLRARWLRACGISRRHGVRLVAKRQIVENLV